MKTKNIILSQAQKKAIDIIRNELKRAQEQYDKKFAKLKKDYAEQFGWVAEELLYLDIQIRKLISVDDVFTNHPDRMKEYMKRSIHYYTSVLLEGGYTNNSTSRCANMVHEKQKEVSAYNIALCKRVLAVLNDSAG